jgi:hypothetical protein
MVECERAARLVVHADVPLRDRLAALARGARMVFFAGLPGTGKSLLVHQLAHLAAAAGRTIHLLQWDVARPVFEASDAGRRYPVADGVTHGVIRRAVGLWARRALLDWDRQHPDATHLLIGETPFIGHRLIELARAEHDATELLLSAPGCRFVIPVPSREVRAFIEAERARRGAHRVHEREREDAPPQVLRDLWRQLVRVAPALGHSEGGFAGAAKPALEPRYSDGPPGISGPSRVGSDLGQSDPDTDPSRSDANPSDDESPYDPGLYQRVYETLLRHRHVEVVALNTVLATASFSAYEFAIAPRDVTPCPEEASALVRAVEACYPDSGVLAREIDRWWLV